MRTSDTRTGYGWISIALHWLTAIVVLTIWFIGSSIHADPATSESTLRLHTSIAITFYVLLWARIVWRFVKGHPGPLPEQAGAFYSIGKAMHYVIIVAIGAMLISGPLMAWSRGDEIHVWSWFAIPAPFETNMDLFDLTHRVHVWCSRIIIFGTLLHLGGVYKHAAFNQDGTFGKMLVAARGDEAPSSRDAGLQDQRSSV
jgi:cytochrome b561